MGDVLSPRSLGQIPAAAHRPRWAAHVLGGETLWLGPIVERSEACGEMATPRGSVVTPADYAVNGQGAASAGVGAQLQTYVSVDTVRRGQGLDEEHVSELAGRGILVRCRQGP